MVSLDIVKRRYLLISFTQTRDLKFEHKTYSYKTPTEAIRFHIDAILQPVLLPPGLKFQAVVFLARVAFTLR